MVRRPALDGLRAIAVLAVMAFHTSPAAHGGFLGVDVFFVISGYLITALLLIEWQQTGDLDIQRFYLRRALRLGPALLVMLLIAVPLMLTVLSASMGIPVWAAVTSSLLYLGNWVNVVADGSTGPLVHTWSLAIEEQFYLVWPAVLLLVLRRRGRLPAGALVAALVAVAGFRWVCWDATGAGWIYYATVSHCDGLIAGALVAALVHQRPGVVVPQGWSLAAASAGVAGLGVLAATLRIDGGATYQAGLLLTALACMPLVHHLATSEASESWLVRVLEARPLVRIGALSYGLYLFHFPIFRAVQALQPGRYSHLEQHLLEFGLTALVTILSWRLVEQPALRLKSRIGQPRHTPTAHSKAQAPGQAPVALIPRPRSVPIDRLPAVTLYPSPVRIQARP